MLTAIATIVLLVASQFHTSAGFFCFLSNSALMCPVVPYPNNIFTGNLQNEAYDALRYGEVRRCDGEQEVAEEFSHKGQKKAYLYKTPNEVPRTMTERNMIKSELGDACKSNNDGYGKSFWNKDRVALYLPPMDKFVMNVIVDLPLNVLVQRFYNITVTRPMTAKLFLNTLKNLVAGVIDFGSDINKMNMQVVVRKANDKCMKSYIFSNPENAQVNIFNVVEEYFAGNKEFFAYVSGAIRAYGTNGQMKWELK